MNNEALAASDMKGSLIGLADSSVSRDSFRRRKNQRKKKRSHYFSVIRKPSTFDSTIPDLPCPQPRCIICIIYHRSFLSSSWGAEGIVLEDKGFSIVVVVDEGSDS